MSTVSLLSDAELSPAAAQAFTDIRATHQTEFVNDIWRLGQRQIRDRTRNEIDFR